MTYELTDEHLKHIWSQHVHKRGGIFYFARACIEADREMRDPLPEMTSKAAKWDAINAVWQNKDAKLEDLVAAILRQQIDAAEAQHGNVGKEGGK